MHNVDSVKMLIGSSHQGDYLIRCKSTTRTTMLIVESMLIGPQERLWTAHWKRKPRAARGQRHTLGRCNELFRLGVQVTMSMV